MLAGEWHCVKSGHIWSFLVRVFSCSDLKRENTDQKNSEYRQLLHNVMHLK